MFQVSKQVDYAVRLMRVLPAADSTDRLALRVFAEDSSISFLFLQKIARMLRMHDLIVSVQGAQGGYRLARPLDEISVKDVIDAIEGGVNIVTCARGASECPQFEGCSTKDVWLRLNAEIENRFAHIPLSEFE